jgi:hypothetical protein
VGLCGSIEGITEADIERARATKVQSTARCPRIRLRDQIWHFKWSGYTFRKSLATRCCREGQGGLGGWSSGSHSLSNGRKEERVGASKPRQFAIKEQMAKQIEIPKTPEVEVQRQEVIAVMNDRIPAEWSRRTISREIPPTCNYNLAPASDINISKFTRESLTIMHFILQ